MSPSLEKRRKRSILHFIWFIVLFFTIQIQFVHTEMSVEEKVNNAVLLQERVLSGKLPPGKFNGKEVTALAYNYLPQFAYTKLKDGNYTFEGHMKEQMDVVVEYLNMSLKYIIIDPVNVTKYGFYGAMNKYLLNKVVDFIPAMVYQKLEMINVMELVTAGWIDPFILLQPFPDEESHLDVTIKPFQPLVWLCFGVSTAGFIMVSAIIIKNKMDIDGSNSNRPSLRQTIYNQVDYVIRQFTNQGSTGNHSRTRNSFKILTGVWLLSMVVLINGYAGVLTSLLTVPRLKPVAQSLKEVAESKELRVTCEKNTYFFDILMNAKEGYEKILCDQLRNDPTLLLSDGIGAINNVFSHKAAYPGAKTVSDYLLYIDTKRNGQCRMTTSNPLKAYSTMALQIILPIGSPYAAVYSELGHRMWANGLVVYERNKYWKSTDRCRVDNPPETKTRALSLVDFLPAFLILGVGISLSAFCFVVEILSKYVFTLTRRKRERLTTVRW